MKNYNVPLPIDALLNNKPNDYISTCERTFRHHDVFLDGEITDPPSYRELISLLFNADANDTIIFFINSGGGNMDSALAIIEALKHTPAIVTAIIVGACHSAASIISMYCDDVIVTESAYSMIHTASFGSSGNTGNVKAHTEFTVRQVEKLLNETYEGFLTKDELAKVKTGVEIWFDSEELRSRINNRVKYLKSKDKKKKVKQDLTNQG